MQTEQTPLLLRDDTMFGVCQALGEDFGFNPNWLRVALAVGLLFSPMATVLGYAAMAPVVLLSRWLAPNPRGLAPPVPAPLEAPANEVEPEQERLPLAA